MVPVERVDAERPGWRLRGPMGRTVSSAAGARRRSGAHEQRPDRSVDGCSASFSCLSLERLTGAAFGDLAVWPATPGDAADVACRTLLPVSVPGIAVDVEKLREVCGRYGVERLEVFGSVSRGDATPDSDVDVLYQLEAGARLGWDIEKLADELSALLGRRVDLVSRNALHERLRDEVLAEALLLYAA